VRLVDLFDRVYIINLPDRADRRRELQRNLDLLDWPTGEPKVIWYPGIKPVHPAGFSSPGYRGCFLSHLAVLNAAKNQTCRSVLILEDDAQITPSLPDLEQPLVDQFQRAAAGIVYFGHCESIDSEGSPTLVRWPHDRGVLLAHCYAVVGPVLPRLCAYLEAMLLRPSGSPDGGPMSPDGALSWFRRQNPDVETLLSVPILAVQRSSRSDLSTRWFDRVPGLRSLAGPARWLRSRNQATDPSVVLERRRRACETARSPHLHQESPTPSQL
jgi:glycosyl transferase, family 25